MEFLTFAPIPFAEMLGADVTPRPAQWDAMSRDIGIVSGLDRWIVGLRGHAETEREDAAREKEPERAERRRRRAGDAEALLRIVELLSGTLDALSGEASWPDWSDRLARRARPVARARERDREAVARRGRRPRRPRLPRRRAPWPEVERVLEARFEWERLPLDPLATGAVHVGVMDALAGLPFRVVAIPGLVEGGYPGVLRPDPFLLDAEREAPGAPAAAPEPAAPARRARTPRPPPRRGQLSLFDDEPAPPPPHAPSAAAADPRRPADRAGPPARRAPRVPARDRPGHGAAHPVLPARRRAHGPRAHAVALLRGRGRRPRGTVAGSGRPRADRARGRRSTTLPLDLALDRSERDRRRVRTGGREAALAISAGSRLLQAVAPERAGALVEPAHALRRPRSRSRRATACPPSSRRRSRASSTP